MGRLSDLPLRAAIESLKRNLPRDEYLAALKEISKYIDPTQLLTSCRQLYRYGLSIRYFLIVCQKYHPEVCESKTFDVLKNLEFSIYMRKD